MSNQFIVSKSTQVTADLSNPVLRNASRILRRDLAATVTALGEANQIQLVLDSQLPASEQFKITRVAPQQLQISSGTARGVMYGALAFSRQVLHVDDFWFWLDTLPQPVPTITVPTLAQLQLPAFRVKYRGWFVNDEVLLKHWDYQESNTNVWLLVYETLLRCGGNLIIPGTDKTAHENTVTAAEMGLILTHHHAEPLGAQMFSRAYPDLDASYQKYPELFQGLWRDAIAAQKDHAVIWTLGFRGQGDRPFWLDDDQHYSLADRGRIISDVIKTQYRLVKAAQPEATCAINIYGELTALSQQGLLDIPADVIQIWADNGYGRMLSRRQGDDDPRTDVLSGGRPDRSQGIYYHVAFHDLQASNFLGLLQIDPHTVAAELEKVHQAGMDDFVMCNTGNIKPNVLFIRLMAQSWRADFHVQSEAQILKDYVAHYYQTAHAPIARLYHDYFAAALAYGPFADQKAGDEFYPYTLRKLVATWLTGRKQLPEMGWLTGDQEFAAQLDHIEKLIRGAIQPWCALAQNVQQTQATLPGADKRRLYNDLWLSVAVHVYPLKALKLVINAIRNCDSATDRGRLCAFVQADAAYRNLQRVPGLWQANPQPKWAHFYDNDCYNNLVSAADVTATLRAHIRLIGDGPDLDQWERQYLMAPRDAKIMLLSNTHRAYNDGELATRLRGRYDWLDAAATLD
ncbi:glycosyl hydrolase 115 family protein [Lactiplantibacillus modestisalitolerans]|uniref:Glycosyl hydrolase 115 family protein n=1 Tax=Lactiplantibacillus modestisalitolerans TaxID=1457219 RepID=A0ABV5WY18_9LACO|nr:glycosyl hydrolase 115 family protein [Lactiplantibacillus modestisalitolerans]